MKISTQDYYLLVLEQWYGLQYIDIYFQEYVSHTALTENVKIQ